MIFAAFIVLHYKNYKDTEACVKSLDRLHGIEKCAVIIYDNGSNDGSADILKEHFKNRSNVRVVKSDIPDGFSTGNNKAYEIARKLSPKFIIALNNDIIIKQRSFLYKLSQIGKRDQYHVIGPDIYAPMVREHQSPLYEKSPDMEMVDRLIEETKKHKEDLQFSAAWEQNRIKKNKIKRFIPAFVIEIIRLFTGNRKSELWKNEVENPVFSGACIIVSDLFIKENSKLFDPETKFYCEELILAKRCETNNYSTLYTPQIKVRHMHGKSTLNAYKDIKDYLDFRYTNMLESYEFYKSLIEGNESKNGK